MNFKENYPGLKNKNDFLKSKIFIFLILSLIFILTLFLNYNFFIFGGDNRAYIQAYECSSNESFLDIYTCFVRSQSNPFPGLAIVQFIFYSLNFDFEQFYIFLGFLFLFTAGIAIRKTKQLYFSIFLFWILSGFYNLYINWSGHKMQLGFIFIFLLFGYLEEYRYNKKSIVSITFRLNSITLGFFSILSHPQMFLPVFMILFLIPIKDNKSVLMDLTFIDNIAKLKVRKSSILFLFIAIIILVFAILILKTKIIGYFLRGGGHRLGTISICIFYAFLAYLNRNNSNRYWTLYSLICSLILPFIIGPSRVPTLLLHTSVITIISRPFLLRPNSIKLILLLLFLYDIFKGLIAMSNGYYMSTDWYNY